MSTHSNDDMLKPSLTADDDAVGFDHPWNPWSLVVLAFFLGVVPGGGLLALNFRRLGLKNRVGITLLWVALAEVVWIALEIWMIRHGYLHLDESDAPEPGRWVMRVFSLGVAIAIAHPQHKRYRLFMTRHLPEGRLVIPACAAVVVTLVVLIIEFVFIHWWMAL
jgi:hypothetical protein